MAKLAVIVPFRERTLHLEVFRRALPYYLKKYHPEIDYFIIVVEQLSLDKPFNRGKLFNVGYALCKHYYKFDYICLHDVDLIPKSVDYSLPENPTHLAPYIQERGYKLRFYENFGGVNLLLNDHFEIANGFCNKYWGWGAEDDDLRLRFLRKGFSVDRRSGYFYSLPHQKDYLKSKKEKNFQIINKAKLNNRKNVKLEKFFLDGLNEIRFTTVTFKEGKEMSWLSVNI